MAKKKQASHIATAVMDDSQPIEHRVELIRHLAMLDQEQFTESLKLLLTRAAEGSGEELYKKKKAEFEELIKEIKAGALRDAIFLEMGKGNGYSSRAHVLLDDGSTAWIPVPCRDVIETLVCGDSVVLEANGKALLARGMNWVDVGEEARFERRVGDWQVEVTLHDHDQQVVRVTARLRDKLDRDEVPADSKLLVCSRRQMAFDAIPQPDGVSKYRYLSKEAIPKVSIKRDIGCPPPCLEELEQHVRWEMTKPADRRRYRLNRCITKLFVGPSGTGKTLSILGFIRRCYEVMSEVCGVTIEELPQRIMRIRTSRLLSEWLGRSDKNIDAFFDEVEQLACEKFVAPDGKEYELPVIICFEEADALGRTRGEDSVYDRVQTVLLQRLDVASGTLKDRLVICLCTSNLPKLLDPAFVRRVGGTVEHFGRLNKQAFFAVLGKLLNDRPLARFNGCDEATVKRQLMSDVAAWVFSSEDDARLVELQYTDAGAREVRYRKDFLTGALIDRAVHEAAEKACEAEIEGTVAHAGLTAKRVIMALHRQLHSVTESLDPHNVHHHLTLPEGTRVTSVRRFEQSSVLPAELEIER
jgi:hypothetical protein